MKKALFCGMAVLAPVWATPAWAQPAPVIDNARVTVRDVVLQPGVVIGSDGFGFAKTDDNSWYKVFQSGIVVIEDDVEVQANSCIDRASIGETRIRKGVKIDNLVQVGREAGNARVR